MKINYSQQGLFYVVYETIKSIHCLHRARSILWQVKGNFLLPKRAYYRPLWAFSTPFKSKV